MDFINQLIYENIEQTKQIEKMLDKNEEQILHIKNDNVKMEQALSKTQRLINSFTGWFSQLSLFGSRNVREELPALEKINHPTNLSHSNISELKLRSENIREKLNLQNEELSQIGLEMDAFQKNLLQQNQQINDLLQ